MEYKQCHTVFKRVPLVPLVPFRGITPLQSIYAPEQLGTARFHTDPMRVSLANLPSGKVFPFCSLLPMTFPVSISIPPLHILSLPFRLPLPGQVQRHCFVLLSSTRWCRHCMSPLWMDHRPYTSWSLILYRSFSEAVSRESTKMAAWYFYNCLLP